jgi:transposase
MFDSVDDMTVGRSMGIVPGQGPGSDRPDSDFRACDQDQSVRMLVHPVHQPTLGWVSHAARPGLLAVFMPELPIIVTVAWHSRGADQHRSKIGRGSSRQSMGRMSSGSWERRCCRRRASSIWPGVWSGGDRAVVTAIICVLTSVCAWRHLPPGFGVLSATAHRRFRQWSRAGVWPRLHRTVLDRHGTGRERGLSAGEKGALWPGRTRSTATGGGEDPFPVRRDGLPPVVAVSGPTSGCGGRGAPAFPFRRLNPLGQGRYGQRQSVICPCLRQLSNG